MVKWTLMVVLGLLAAPLSAQELTASVDRSTVYEGESLQLTITYNGVTGGQEPDFSVLEAGFVVMDSGTSSRINIVNGQRTVSTSWTVLLEPRQEGKIIIPSFELYGKRTDPITITIEARENAAVSPDKNLFIEMTATPSDPYVHSQVLITIKLYHRKAITEGRLFEPEIDSAVVERLGEDNNYTATLDGQQYRVVERRFAVFPESSGALDIPAARFRGRISEAGNGYNSIFDRGRRVSVASESLSLNVLPAPSASSGAAFIPASELTIEEFWPEGGTSFVVGEPATRTIQVKARGLLAPQLPELTIPDTDQVKVYRDQPKTQSTVDKEKEWVYATLEQSYALVPTDSGTLTLPEIRIPWWNTLTDSQEVAVIPAREIVVQPSSRQVAAPPTPGADSAAGQSEGLSGQVASPGWYQYGFWAVAGLWIITLGLWYRERRDRQPGARRSTPDQVETVTVRKARQELKQACHANDARNAARTIVALARAQYPGERIGSVSGLADRVAAASLAHALSDLDRVLYSSDTVETWRGDKLWNEISGGITLAAQAANAKNKEEPGLPPLYSR